MCNIGTLQRVFGFQNLSASSILTCTRVTVGHFRVVAQADFVGPSGTMTTKLSLPTLTSIMEVFLH